MVARRRVIAAVLLGLAFHLLPYVEQMVTWRKERGLAGYDPKQFGAAKGLAPMKAEQRPDEIPAKAGIQ